MQPSERRRLVDTFAIQAETGRTRTMRKHVRRELEAAGCRVRQLEHQLYARKGSSNDPVPFIVAHADTVHAIVEPHRYRVAAEVDSSGDWTHYAYDPTTGKDRGIGGDDKCGLWIAIETARRLDDVGVIITVDEEIGGKGARRVPALELANAAAIIQADRRGNGDAIYDSSGVEISSPVWRAHVTPLINAYGYRWSDYGTLTDVSEMSAERIARVSCVNLSAGYYGAHTSGEYVQESEVENALELTVALAQASAGKRWKHVAEHRWSARYDDGFGYGAWSPRARAYSPIRSAKPANPQPGSVWQFGSYTFRMDEDRAWREVDADPLIVIPCDVPGCKREAEDWHPVARLTLCGDHLTAADYLSTESADAAEIVAALA